MDQEFFGKKDQQLSYTELIFRRIDQISYLFATYYSGDIKTASLGESYTKTNLYLALSTLEALIYQRLSKDKQEEFSKERGTIIDEVSERQLRFSNLRVFTYWFNLCLKYLPFTGYLPKKRTAYDTGGSK